MNMVEIKTIAGNSYSINEAFKALRTNVQFCGANIKCIAFTSCLPNEGKSSVSLELAKSLSESGKKVIVIDADLRKSVLVNRLSKMPDQIIGLSQYLTDQDTFESIVYETQYPNLKMIFSGPFPPNPVELLECDRFREMIAMCKEQYDYVLIDTPPLGVVIDAAVVATLCDGTIMVIAADRSSYKIAQSVKDQLLRVNGKILGTILNMAENKRRVHKYRYVSKDKYYHGYKAYRYSSKSTDTANSATSEKAE